MAARTLHFHRLARLTRLVLSGAPDASLAPRHGMSQPARPSRRQFLAASTAALTVPLARSVSAASPRVAIVGAGLAGLACADRLQTLGIVPTLYEAGTRVGGRCASLRGVFPGQVAELGGEYIDNLHKTMLGYARRFGLATEDVTKLPGEETFFIDGQHFSESDVVAEYRLLVPRLRADLKTTSGAPTFFAHTAGDRALDQIDLATYLATRAADLPLIRKVLTVAYEGEYGLDAAEQSCLNLLLFIHADRRSWFQPWGVFSDERYHLVDGNDGIVAGLADDFTGAIELGRELTALRRNGFGEFVLEFRAGAAVTADVVVVTVPFSVLRHVHLDATLALSADKMRAIRELGYGTNAKTMIGFDGVPWRELHQASGAAVTTLAHVQNTWETNPSRAGSHSVLTDYAAGGRGRGLDPSQVQAQVDAFLTDLDMAWPGVKARASRDGAYYVTSVAHWPSSPLSRGSYTCYRPGQFTRIAGLEGQRAGHLHFAGEHTDSFYSWQGFMEGACLSGLAAADAVARDAKRGR